MIFADNINTHEERAALINFDYLTFDYLDNERAMKMAAREFVESINLSPAERERREALIVEFVPPLDEDADLAAEDAPLSPAEHAARDAPDEATGKLDCLGDHADDNQPEPQHVEHNLDARIDGLTVERRAETPIVEDIDPPSDTGEQKQIFKEPEHVEPQPTEQPEHAIVATVDPNPEIETYDQPTDDDKARIDALLDELDIIEEHDTDDDQPEPAGPALGHDNDNAPANLPQPSKSTAAGAKANASFPQKRRRRSQSHDRKAIATTRVYGLSTAPGASAPICRTSSTPLSPSLSTDSHDSLTPTPSVAPASEFHLPTAANDNEPHLRIWENSTDYIKLIYSNRALAVHGTPFHFTLNFGPKVAKAALRAKKGIRPFIADRLQKALKKIGRDGAFWFVLDVTPSGRVHVHGGIGLNPSQEGAARAILHRVAGKWGSNHHKERQVDLDEQTDVDGWIDNYCFRKAKVRSLGETPLYIARPLRQIARDNYERDRAILNSQQKPGSTNSSSSTSPSTSPSSLILFAATGADHSAHSSPVAPAGLAGVAEPRQALRRSSWPLPVRSSRSSFPVHSHRIAYL